MLNGAGLNDIGLNAPEAEDPPPPSGSSFALNARLLNRDPINASVAAGFEETGEGQLIGIEQQLVLFPPMSRTGFQLNKRYLNLDPLNGSVDFSIRGEGLLISIEQSVSGVAGPGQLIGIEQTVGITQGPGELISIEQEVVLHLAASGQLIAIEQSVINSGVGSLIRIEQTVISSHTSIPDAPIPDHITRTGWDATIMVGGMEIPHSQIHGLVDITRNEGGAALMDFTIIPELGIQNVESYAGKPVTVDIRTQDGIFRAYTGIVDVPDVDLIQKKITFHCTDRRTELINTQLVTTVKTIGIYSAIIFGGEAKNPADELADRLTTIPFTVDFDAFGIYNLTALAPKTVPDFTLTGDKIYYRDPKIEFTSRGRITNKVTIGFQYRYARLWHMQRQFQWASPIASNWCLFMNEGYTLAQRVMLQSAIEGLGWPVRGEISYVDIPASGYYCGAFWSSVHLTGTTAYLVERGENGQPILDPEGNPTYITDSKGDKIVDPENSRITGGTDMRPLFANGVSWQSTTRWLQTVTENYTMVVQAPQSQTQFGDVEQSNNYSADDPTDYGYWENEYKVYNNPYNQMENTYFINAATNRGEANAAMGTALSIAKTTIITSHRDTRVTIYRSLWPQVDLKHTVQINSSLLNAKGKVYTINHLLDVGSGEAVTRVTLALSRSQGSQADSALSIPGIPVDTIEPTTTPIVLGNHYGEDPTTIAAANWNGRIGNKFVPRFGFITSRSTYTEQFIVDTPEIEDSVRQERNLSGGGTYNVAIPNDLLEIIF